MHGVMVNSCWGGHQSRRLNIAPLHDDDADGQTAAAVRASNVSSTGPLPPSHGMSEMIWLLLAGIPVVLVQTLSGFDVCTPRCRLRVRAVAQPGLGSGLVLGSRSG